MSSYPPEGSHCTGIGSSPRTAGGARYCSENPPMDWLRSTAQRLPGAPALVGGGRVLSYAALDAAADAAAAALAAGGVVPGDRVAFWGEGTAAAVAAVWGIPRAGAVAMPLGTRLAPAEAMALTRALGGRVLWGPGPNLRLPRPPVRPGQASGRGGPPPGGGRAAGVSARRA